jgi:hypothetical protein
MTIDECPGSVTAALATKLKDPALKPASTRWLYPYDQTVFPRGLAAPILQWDPATTGATAIYIHLKSMRLDYQMCLPLTETARIQIPQKAWDLAAAQSRGRPDPLTVDVVVASTSSTVRLPALTLTFALADLKGAVYYNTYGSVLAMNMGITGGVVMRALPGAAKPPEVFLSAGGSADQCIGCHSVSADGSRILAEVHQGGGIIEGASRSFDLSKVGAGANPKPIRDDLKRAGFSGVYPDGSVYVTTARLFSGPGPLGNPAAGIGNISGTFGPEESKLFDTMAGTEIQGSGVHPYSFMPTFSVDGHMLVFNSVAAASTSDGGHTLAVMDFDRASNRFTNPREIYRDASLFPSWPFFLPDVMLSGAENTVDYGKRVVFALVSNNDLVTGDAVPSLTAATGDLYWVDVATKTASALGRANGSDNGTVYLPYGASEARLNFVPTVSPVAAGGYFWVFFTSKRNYGNIRVNQSGAYDATSKKIWVAALDIEAAPGTDPSHPAFYLPNQELESGNIRAFAALEPCRNQGDSCQSGVDCCCGFCASPDAGAGVCECEQHRCSNIDEKCKTAADCCTSGAACVGGFCQFTLQ